MKTTKNINIAVSKEIVNKIRIKALDSNTSMKEYIINLMKEDLTK